MEKIKTYRRYLVIAVDVEVDCSQTDQNPDNHIDEIAEQVYSEMDYSVEFSDKVESGIADNAIEVPVNITNTTALALLDYLPLGIES